MLTFNQFLPEAKTKKSKKKSPPDEQAMKDRILPAAGAYSASVMEAVKKKAKTEIKVYKGEKDNTPKEVQNSAIFAWNGAGSQIG